MKLSLIIVLVGAWLMSCGGPSTYDRAVESCGSAKRIAELSDDGFRCKKRAEPHYFGAG
jgi:hypothetical protein